jgi:ATP/maltotriose-dependent transcriptional regulator MalT
VFLLHETVSRWLVRCLIFAVGQVNGRRRIPVIWMLRTWADRAGRGHRIAFMPVRPGQQDAQAFWLALLAAVRSASGAGESTEPPPTPGFNAPAMVDKVLSEVGAVGKPFVLIIDDLHELAFPEATEQLTELLAGLPPRTGLPGTGRPPTPSATCRPPATGTRRPAC